MSLNLYTQINEGVHKVANQLDDEMTGSGESEFLLIFNKTSGAYIGHVVGHVNETKSDSTHYKFKKVKFDPTVYEWRGDFDTGELKRVIDAPVMISEEFVDNQTNYSIRDVYDWYHQMNVMMDVMGKVIEKNDMDGDEVEDFKQVHDYIKGRREAGTKFKEAYKGSPDFQFETKQQMVDRVGRELDGGLHEALGPKSEQMPHHDIAEGPDVKSDNLWMVNQGVGGVNKGNVT